MNNNLTLLYVEDDLETIDNIKFFLKRYFSEIYIALDGEEALKIFNEKNPDIIILDINIPKISGLKVASKIREKDNNTSIIFLTAYSDREKLFEAINLQVFSYIVKPLKIELLIKTINKCIKNSSKENLDENKKILSDGFCWDINKKDLYFNDVKIPITKNEILLIELFVNNSCIFFKIDEIKEYVFGLENVKNNSITQLISRLRKKIHELTNSNLFFIENIYNEGYRLK